MGWFEMSSMLLDQQSMGIRPWADKLALGEVWVSGMLGVPLHWTRLVKESSWDVFASWIEISANGTSAT